MNEDIIKKIKNYPIDIDGQTREHIISLGKEQIITNQIKQRDCEKKSVNKILL